jgi:hypothetical protein
MNNLCQNLKMLRNINLRAVLLIALASLIKGCASNQSYSEAFYVNEAVPKAGRCDVSDLRQRLFYCHRIENGDAVVIAQRNHTRDSKGSPLLFEKVTLALTQLELPEIGGSKEFQNLRVFYSTGSAEFAGKSGCFGEILNGEVVVQRMAIDKLKIKIQGSAELSSPLGWKSECGLVQLRKEFFATKREFTQLSPWDGNPIEGANVWAEANPTSHQQ